MVFGSQLAQTSQLRVTLNGQDASPTDLDSIVEVAIDQDLVLPDAFILRFLDLSDQPAQSRQPIFPLLDADRFKVGDTVTISLGREATPKEVLSGLVTGIELEARQDGTAMFVVRGYDRGILLHRQRRTRTFVQVTDSDIVTKLAAENGLQARVTSTSLTYTHVYQDNLTDWEFLRGRAHRIGYELFVDGSELVFRKTQAGVETLSLEYGSTLRRLRARLSAPAQVSEVEVRGWDPATQQAIVGSASSATGLPADNALLSQGAAKGALLSTGKVVVANRPVETQSEAEQMAQAVFDEIAHTFVALDGVCIGSPTLQPGMTIDVKGVGTRFSGSYYVSGTRHTHTASEGYLTQFVVNGKRPATLAALLSDRQPTWRDGTSVHPGVMIGVVTNNKDTDNLGRVQIKLPEFSDDQQTRWVRQATAMAGSDFGTHFTPEVNTEVLVAFEHGDINQPYIIGALWNDKQKPPQTTSEAVDDASGTVQRRIIKTRTGHTITIDDSTTQPGIRIVDKTGNNQILIDSQTNNITLKASGNLSLEATGGITLKGATVDVKATASLALQGATSSLKGDGEVSINGALVRIN